MDFATGLMLGAMVHPIRFGHTEEERGVLYAADYDAYEERLECGRIAEFVGSHSLKNYGIGLDVALSYRLNPALSLYLGMSYEYRRIHTKPGYASVMLEQNYYDSTYWVDADTTWRHYPHLSEYAYQMGMKAGVTRRSALPLSVPRLFVPFSGQLLDVRVYRHYQFFDEERAFYDEYGLYKRTGLSIDQMKKACVPSKIVTDLECYTRLDLKNNFDDVYRYLEVNWQFIPRVVVAKHLIVPLFDAHGERWYVSFRDEGYPDPEPDRAFVFLPWLGLRFEGRDWGLSSTFDHRDFLRSFEIVFWKTW